MQYPDSPEGVAFALMTLIVSAAETKLPADRDAVEGEVLALYRRCLNAAQGRPCAERREEVQAFH